MSAEMNTGMTGGNPTGGSANINKRDNSIVWKLVRSEAGRLLETFMKLNSMMAIICAILLLFWAEWQAGAAMHHGWQSGYAADSAAVLMVDSPSGIRIADWIARPLSLPEGSYRGFRIAQNPAEASEPPYHILNFYRDRDYRNLHYVVAAPSYDGRWLEVRLDLGTPIFLILIGFAAVFLLQIWYTLYTLFYAQRAVRRILRPIYELTMTAQSMGAYEPIPLDGTINALNAITEEHLDRRIAVEGERDELRGLAMAINSMLARLDAAYKSQLRFVSDASHELRTPIAIIQGYANLLSRWGKDDPKTLQESIDAIKSEAAGMQLLIEQLLFLARSDNRSIPLIPERINVSALAAEVAKDTRVLALTHEIEEQIEPDLYVMGDIQLLKQAIRILVDNAAKYSPNGDKIVIGVCRSGGMTRLQVTDQGTGIDDEDLQNLFERFWRADESRGRKTGGTGLGLSIAKWIVDAHGGQIEVLSRKEIGTRTSILLPESVVDESGDAGSPDNPDGMAAGL